MKHRPLLLLLIPMVLVFANIMSFFLDDYTHDFSLTQRYRRYFALYNWDLPFHAISDFDQDGRKDEIAFNGCAYLSTIHTNSFSISPECNPTKKISYIVDPEIDKNAQGQKLPFGDPSFLVQTKVGSWKYYAYGFFRQNIYELGKDNIFHKVQPTILDIVDYVWYMPSHILLIYLPI